MSSITCVLINRQYQSLRIFKIGSFFKYIRTCSKANTFKEIYRLPETSWDAQQYQERLFHNGKAVGKGLNLFDQDVRLKKLKIWF